MFGPDQRCEANLAWPSPAARCGWRCRVCCSFLRRVPDSAAQGGLLLHMRQLLGIAYGVQPGDEAGVDAYGYDGVDLAVEAEDQRRVAVDLCLLQRRRG